MNRPFMPSTSDIVPQAAAIPIQSGRICLVTAVSGKGWVIPKGCQEPGQTQQETATQEAWEEAGLCGILSAKPVGSYQYQKWGKTCQVAVFTMHVSEVADDWPERSQRQRRLFTLEEGLPLIVDPRLQQVIREAWPVP